MRRVLALWSIVLAALLTGCQTLPPETPTDLDDRVVFAAELLEQGQIDAAYAVLRSVDGELLSEDSAVRYSIASARAFAAKGRLRTAFCRFLDDFPRRFRFRPEIEAAAALHESLCEALLERDGSFWWACDFFTGDKGFAQERLLRFLERYPGHARGANVLRLLGELHEEATEWPLARFRYEELLQEYPDSEWVPYAQFRLAISSFEQVEGVCYDEGQMRIARRELQTYLNLQPELPQAVREASEALAQVETWLAQRWLQNAEFYRTIENDYGERRQLDLVLREFPDSPEAEIARKRLGLVRQDLDSDGGTP